MVHDVPLIILSSTICTYWSTVLLLVLYRRIRHRQKSGLVPKQVFERVLWLLIVPMVLGWITLPILTINAVFSWLTLPAWAYSEPAIFGLRILAAGVGVGGYLLSLYCWLLMGRNWSMAIVPKQASQLVTDGIYRWVRHPIYSLSVLLMLCSMIVLPNLPMVMLACLHSLVMNLKAWNEERHLRKCFGVSYVQYCERVGRFLPRLISTRKAA